MLNGGIEKKFPSFKISSKPSTFARLLLNGGTQNYGNLEQVLFIYFWLLYLESGFIIRSLPYGS